MATSKPTAAPAFSEKVAAVPFVRRVLPNGLTLLIERDPTHPLVAFHATVRTGSATEGPFLGTGISHVVEHMLFKGTARRGVGAVEKEARSYGGTSQGFTSLDTTSYQLIVNKEFWSQAADLMVDALFFPSMDPEEFSKEKEVVLRELRLGKDDPSHRVWELLFENAYRMHPYRVPIIGLEPLLKGLTREDLVAYHRSHYRPNNIVIAVAGDIEPEQVIRRMEELTRSISPGVVSSAALPEEPPHVSPREVMEEGAVSHAVVTLGFPGISLDDPDLFALDLLSVLLGGGRGSRLDRLLKESGTVHAVQCMNYTPLAKGLFIVTLRMDEEKVPTALELFWRECTRVQEDPFADKEIEEAKRALLREYLASRQTVAGQASDLATFETALGDPGFASRYIEGIRQVTAQDLQRLARRTLDAQRATRATLLPKGSPLRDKEELSSPSIHSPVAKKQVLENGLRVILREDHRLPLVMLQVSLPGGVRFETSENNGLSYLTPRMLLRGTRQRSSEEIIDWSRRIGGELQAVSGRNSLGLSLEITRGQLSEGISLLGELIREPSFPAGELEKERSLALALLSAREEDPFAWGMKRLVSALFTRHPYRLDPYGDEESLRRIQPLDLVTFYQRIRNPQEMVLSVVGDFEEGKVLPLLHDSFGSMPSGPWAALSLPEEPPLVSLREHQEETPRQEALLMIGFPGLRLEDSRVPALDLLDTILSGGAGRLFTQVREARGLAYTVGALAMHGIDPGVFFLYAVTDPSHLSEVRQALLSELRRLRKELVPQEEFQQAQQGLLGARRIARQSLGSVAAQMALDELYGLGFDFSDRYEAQVKATTPQEIQRVAQEILDPQRCVVVVGQPRRESAEVPRKEPSEQVPLAAVE